jgi:hypothetical protein
MAERIIDIGPSARNGRTAEQQNGKTAERQKGRMAERQNGRTAERQNGRTAERQSDNKLERQYGYLYTEFTDIFLSMHNGSRVTVRQKGCISNLRNIFDDLQKSRVTERQNGSKVTYNNSESKIPDISTTQKDTDGYDDDRKCRNIRSAERLHIESTRYIRRSAEKQSDRTAERSKVTYNNSESKIPDISTTQKDTDGYDDDRKCRNIRSHSGRQGSSSG